MIKTYTIEEFSKLPSAKNRGVPMTVWGTTGGANAEISDGSDLRQKLKKGMKEKEIDDLASTGRGRKVIDDYMHDRTMRDNQVKEISDGVFDHEELDGSMSKEVFFDHNDGRQDHNVTE
jgi:hypothetical protein